MLRAQGKLVEATSALRTAIQLRPNSPEAHVGLGLACLEQNDASGAVDAFAAAIRLKPDYAEAHWNHGLALLLARGRQEGGREPFNDC